MNTFALKGHKVRLKKDGFSLGTESNKLRARTHLRADVIYTVERMQVGSSWSHLTLSEIPDVSFSPIHFEDVSVQSPERDREHPDWLKYMGYWLRRKYFKGIDITPALRELGYSPLSKNDILSKWYKEERPSKIEAELKDFEKKVTADLTEGQKKKISLFVQACLEEPKEINKIRKIIHQKD